jgi:hypothetical protein
MKKTYVYFLAPLVGLIIFGAIYWNFSKGFAAREAARVAAEKQKKEDKLRAQAKANEQAIREALAAQERRKAERAAKEAKDKADHEARQAAQDAKEKAYRDQEKFAKTVDRLEKELAAEKDAIAKLQVDKKKFTDEQAFLRIYVKQAEDNVKNLLQVLEKIAAADDARAKADAAAAAEATRRRNS